MAMMPSPVTAVMAKSPIAMALPSQIVDSTITSDKLQQQQLQTAAKYLTSVKSSPQSPSSSPQSPQPPSLLHQTSSLVQPVKASLTISSATTLSSAGGYHSNLISRISSNSMNSSSNNSTVKDKVQISCNLSQDMEVTGSKNNNNLSNETNVNQNNNNNNNNNNLNLIENNTTMHTHHNSRSSSSIMNDATASSLQMSSLLDDSCCPSKMGSSSSPLNFLRFPSVGGGIYGAAEVNNAVVNCLSSGDNALNLSNIGKSSEITVTATPLISSSGIVQSRMASVTGMSTSLRNDEGSDLMRRGNFGQN